MASLLQRSVASARHLSSSAKPYSTPLLLNPTDIVVTKHRLLDATWFMPNVARDPAAEFAQCHVPQAQFWPVDDIADHSHPLGLKHMLPSAETFAQACSQRGISNTDHVVVYDTHGVFSSPRTLFTFKAFGHDKVSVLDGGLPHWRSLGLVVEAGPGLQPTHTPYKVSPLQPDFIKSYEQMVHNSELGNPTSSESAYVLDARPNGRFVGKDPEPRPNLKSGHIPNSLSLPFNAVLEEQQQEGHLYKTFLAPDDLEQVLVNSLDGDKHSLEKILTGQKPVTTTCGSGMTAAVTWLAFNILAQSKGLPPPKLSLYDESWTGYASRPESKIDTSI